MLVERSNSEQETCERKSGNEREKRRERETWTDIFSRRTVAQVQD